jgi:hypothetical protein
VSLPNGTVAMEFGECDSCERTGHTIGDGQPYGLNCACGHHFHIGPALLAETTPIFCPRCEGATLPWEITGGSS